MRIAVFGGTGRTGSRLVAMALERGDSVCALARDTSRLPVHPRLTPITGDARDASAIGDTLRDAEAVHCCLGLADISRPSTEFSDSLRAIVATMQAHGPRRIVAIASAGALPDAGGGLRMDRSPGGAYRHINAEHARNYATLRDSGLDWTLVCAVDLKEDIPAGHARIAYEDLPAGSHETGYADLAATMLALTGDASSFGKRVGIVSVR